MQRDSMAICPDSQMLIGQSVCCAFVVRGSWETVGRTWAQRWASSSVLGLATDGLWSGRAHGRKPSVVDVFVPFCQHTLGPARRPARASIKRYCCSSNTQLQRRRQDARITNLLSYITPFECFQFWTHGSKIVLHNTHIVSSYSSTLNAVGILVTKFVHA